MALFDFLAITPTGQPYRVDGFPFALALVPAGATIPGISADITAGFMIEPDCAMQALNDPAFGQYLRLGVAIAIYARRARDLRPFLRRREAFRRRSYAIEVLPMHPRPIEPELRQ